MTGEETSWVAVYLYKTETGKQTLYICSSFILKFCDVDQLKYFITVMRLSSFNTTFTLCMFCFFLPWLFVIQVTSDCVWLTNNISRKKLGQTNINLSEMASWKTIANHIRSSPHLGVSPHTIGQFVEVHALMYWYNNSGVIFFFCNIVTLLHWPAGHFMQHSY